MGFLYKKNKKSAYTSLSLRQPRLTNCYRWMGDDDDDNDNDDGDDIMWLLVLTVKLATI